MSESKMLGMACISMLVLSIATAFVLIFAGASPVMTVVVGTFVGVVVYIGICIFSRPYLIETTSDGLTDEAEAA
jgi:hypothetical protein